MSLIRYLSREHAISSTAIYGPMAILPRRINKQNDLHKHVASPIRMIALRIVACSLIWSLKISIAYHHLRGLGERLQEFC